MENEEEVKPADQGTNKGIGDRVDSMLLIDNATVKDLGNGMFSCTVTTSEIDRMGQNIDTEGITTDTYMKNPVVLYGHDYSALPIGKTLSLKQFKNKLTATFQLAVDEYDFAATVAKMIKGGYLNAVSIGGVIKGISPDWQTIQQMEMVEFSVVPVPANASALISRSLQEVTGKSQPEIAKEYHDFVEKAFAKKLEKVDSHEIAQYIGTIEKLLGILKANADKEPESKPEKEVFRLTTRKAANEIARTSENIIRLVKSPKE